MVGVQVRVDDIGDRRAEPGRKRAVESASGAGSTTSASRCRTRSRRTSSRGRDAGPGGRRARRLRGRPVVIAVRRSSRACRPRRASRRRPRRAAPPRRSARRCHGCTPRRQGPSRVRAAAFGSASTPVAGRWREVALGASIPHAGSSRTSSTVSGAPCAKRSARSVAVIEVVDEGERLMALLLRGIVATSITVVYKRRVVNEDTSHAPPRSAVRTSYPP